MYYSSVYFLRHLLLVVAEEIELMESDTFSAKWEMLMVETLLMEGYSMANAHQLRKKKKRNRLHHHVVADSCPSLLKTTDQC
jgi:hypothetical protein